MAKLRLLIDVVDAYNEDDPRAILHSAEYLVKTYNAAKSKGLALPVEVIVKAIERHVMYLMRLGRTVTAMDCLAQNSSEAIGVGLLKTDSEKQKLAMLSLSQSVVVFLLQSFGESALADREKNRGRNLPLETCGD